MILKGKAVADKIKKDISSKIDSLKENGLTPTLGLIRVGEKADDIFYENSIIKKAEEVGVKIKRVQLPENVTQEEMVNTVEFINGDEEISGILVFRPLPKHLDENHILNKISVDKDIDGVTALSMAGVFTGEKIGFPPCTSEAVIRMLKYYEIPISGAKATVLGRSLVIGKPVAQLLLNLNATVTVCHSKTEDVTKWSKEADILVTALGKLKFVDENFINPNQCVIDVGINWDVENKKMAGDVDFEKISDSVRHITPVPGGIGTVTSYLLLEHTVEALIRRKKQV